MRDALLLALRLRELDVGVGMESAGRGLLLGDVRRRFESCCWFWTGMAEWPWAEAPFGRS